MKLLNVRLREEDVARVRELQRRGVRVSDVVRAALASAVDEGIPKRLPRPRDVAEFLRQLDERYPIPANEPHPGIDVADRRAVARHLRERFASRRKR